MGTKNKNNEANKPNETPKGVTEGTAKIFKIYTGECPVDETVVEYSMPVSSQELKGFYIGADGGVEVTINDYYDTILEVSEDITGDSVANQKDKLRTLEKEARGNWLTLKFNKSTSSATPATKISIFAEFI